MNASRYQDMINEYLVPTMGVLYPEGYRLQHDLATPHTAKSTTDFLKSNEIRVLPWIANSPDFNPIENIWLIMKRRLEAMEPKSVAEWKVKIQEIWEQLSHELVESLIRSLSRRIEECIASGGEVTKH